VQTAVKCRGVEYLRIVYTWPDSPGEDLHLRTRGLWRSAPWPYGRFALGIEVWSDSCAGVVRCDGSTSVSSGFLAMKRAGGPQVVRTCGYPVIRRARQPSSAVRTRLVGSVSSCVLTWRT